MTFIEFERRHDRALLTINGRTIRMRRANALKLAQLLRDFETGEFPVMDGNTSFGLLVDGDAADLVFADNVDVMLVARLHRSQGHHLAAQLEAVTPQED